MVTQAGTTRDYEINTGVIANRILGLTCMRPVPATLDMSLPARGDQRRTRDVNEARYWLCALSCA